MLYLFCDFQLLKCIEAYHSFVIFDFSFLYFLVLFCFFLFVFPNAQMPKTRRIEADLERTVASGVSLEGQGLRSDEGGVWMNDLKALRKDIA